MALQTATKTTKTIPYIRELPFIGRLADFTNNRLGLYRRLAAMGDVYGFHIGLSNVVMFNKPEYVQRILIEGANDTEKGRLMHKVFKSSLSDREGIFISEGEFHHRQRKLIAPPFQPRHIISYADVMTHYGERIQQEWLDGETIDVDHAMTSVTMSIIGKVLFDADVFNEADELGSAITTVLAHMSYKIAHLFAAPDNWPTPRNRRALQAALLIRDRLQQMIDTRKDSQEDRNDFLSIILHARDEDGNSMDHDQIMEECITLFEAGHETTAATLAWSWYQLCQHPQIYQQVRQEVDSVLQGRTPTYADLARLPYCLQVFKETLRLYPAAYGIVREALHDLEIDGYHLPKGITILISPYLLHRKEQYFPEPDKFDPDRFTPEREKQLPRYAYLPFGAGPRICIGNYFAMMEGHLLLATLAQRVTFELRPGQTLKPDPEHALTLRPNGPVNVVVRKRNLAAN
jgi:cytochrome P450